MLSNEDTPVCLDEHPLWSECAVGGEEMPDVFRKMTLSVLGVHRTVGP